MRIALVVPHMFMQDELLDKVIFAPGKLAISLAEGFSNRGHDVTLFSPGKVLGNFKNITADISLINKDLESRGYDINTLIQKHPLTYITFARQLQSEIISKAYKMANEGYFDLVHVYITEEDIALEFAQLCNKPVIFTHHEPFNFLTKYRTSFEKYQDLNWLSISYSQRKTIKSKMNWVANIYHGIESFGDPDFSKNKEYFAYLGRIIEPKGVHLGVEAIKKVNKLKTLNSKPIILLIAGKYYYSNKKDDYWTTKISPNLSENVRYVGFKATKEERFEFLKNAKALLVPSTWEEPFGMVLIEALSVGTPVIGLDNGAIPEIVEDGINGLLVKSEYKMSNFADEKKLDEWKVVNNLVGALLKIDDIDRRKCFESFDKKFREERMIREHLEVYEKVKDQKSKA